MYKAIFFDLDETLIDASACHSEANEKAFAHHGLSYKKLKRRQNIMIF